MEKSIVITFDELGAIEIEGNGFKGKACEEKMQAFIDALGVPVSSIKKPEYYQEDKTHLHN